MLKKSSNQIVWGSDSFVTATLHSIYEYESFFHNELELLLVINGQVKLEIAEKSFTLKEDNFVLINSNQLHTTKPVNGDNLVLSIKIDPSFYYGMFDQLKDIYFINNFVDCQESQQEAIARLKQLMAKVVLSLDKHDDGHHFKLGSYLYLIGETLYSNFYNIETSKKDKISDTNYYRLQRVIDYVYLNYNKDISLKQIAEKENLNYFYLSHFIKDNLGVSFQEFINTVRLNEAVRLLVDTKLSITEVSNKSGFSNISSFNNFFKDKFEMTPSQYRKKLDLPSVTLRSEGDLEEVNKSLALSKLKSYLSNDFDEITSYESLAKVNLIKANFDDKGVKFQKHWKNHVYYGSAHEGLSASWQREFKKLQDQSNMNYIGFYGMFYENMRTYTFAHDGSLIFNWTYVNELIDFLIDNNIKPHIVFSWDEYRHNHPHRDLDDLLNLMRFGYNTKLWQDMLMGFLKHCINRYGQAEVDTWYFELWEDPVLQYRKTKVIDYEQFEFYKKTVKMIKSVSKTIKVGGPSISKWHIATAEWYSEFIKYMVKEDVALDYMSVDIYSEYYTEELKYDKNSDDLLMDRLLHPDSHLIDTLASLQGIKKDYFNNDLEVHVTRWNLTSVPGNYLSDTAYLGTFVVKNMLETINKVESIGFWPFNDLQKCSKFGCSHFCGGLGLVNRDLIKKPSYNALYLLNKLGSTILEQGENYIVTKDNEDIQILMFNHAKISKEFREGDKSLLSNEDRYHVFNKQDDSNFDLSINNINGRYKVTTYSQNREVGSAFDEWAKLGYPENMSREQIAYLKIKDSPRLTTDHLELVGKFKTEVKVPLHGIEMITLEKII